MLQNVKKELFDRLNTKPEKSDFDFLTQRIDNVEKRVDSNQEDFKNNLATQEEKNDTFLERIKALEEALRENTNQTNENLESINELRVKVKDM